MRTRHAALVLVAALTAGCSASGAVRVPTARPPLVAPRLPAHAEAHGVAWPDEGQASYALAGRVHSSPGQRPVPIASVAKVMTAYLAVHRLRPGARIVVDAGDVADAARRRRRGESVVRVARGEVLTRDQALTALLLPSANNVAAMLAERVGGSWTGFVDLMNVTARQLGMRDTTYTDPSGYQPSTVSTAHDQLLLWRAAIRSPVLARVMGLRTASLPITGRVDNINTLLGEDGFVAGKTGSTTAAGGCLAFRVVRRGRVLDGVVLGQHGGRLVDAGLSEAKQLARQALPAYAS